MTIAKNRILTGVLALALVAVIGIFSTASAFAASSNAVDPYAGVEYETIQTPTNESVADFVKDLTMLTEAEKQQLIDESVDAQSIIDYISALEKQIDKITNRILAEGKTLFDERGKIFDEHEALWEKLWSNMNNEQNKLDDSSAIIKASAALTDSEKEVLLKAQSRLDMLEEGIDGYYAKAAEATRELTAQRDQAAAELQELYAKSAHIWAKAYGE